MKAKLRVRISMPILMLLGAAFTQVAGAQEDGYGAYLVPQGRTNKQDHVSADFMVFHSTQQPSLKNGLLFMQKKGPYRNAAFVCDDAPYDSASKSYSCSKLVPRGAKVIKETLSVGIIDGNYCETLRGRPGGEGRIMRPDECPAGTKCACYELDHQCWDGSGYGAACPAEDESSTPPDGQGFAPPSKGAGSGGSH